MMETEIESEVDQPKFKQLLPEIKTTNLPEEPILKPKRTVHFEKDIIP